ncbi:hypothetical protein H6B14_05545 [Phocaeicola coprophilus]|nr:hypothetical protein [Phocaeicola coprophilus]
MRTRTPSPLRHLLAAVVLLSGIAACSDTDCTTSNTAYVNYNIYDANGNSVSLTGPVTVTAAGTDSVLINQESNLQSMQLPLRYTSTEDTFVVHLSEVLFDTIFVTHQNIPHFISMECGTGMYYHIDNARCTRRIFDSISVVNPDINFDANEHIQMYMPAN